MIGIINGTKLMNIPKEDGYYWYKDGDMLLVIECQHTLCKSTDFFYYFMGDYKDYLAEELTGEFISKITPPDIKE